ncbi:MAG: carbohydrate-binding domain-containing protein, partial [Clostridia bacterium]|nr:carbohydrate-binding domain-containing protein [Clostridia bacterium]
GDDVSREEPVTDKTVDATETDGEFTISTSGGKFTKNGSAYILAAAGTYALSGKLEGQIIVEAGKDDEVVLELNGVTITCGTDSPIKITSAGDVEISAKSGTGNVINDTRPEKTADDANQGEGAIYAKADLKLKGTGTLEINASYNNGVHTTKDLTVQKLSLKVSAPNNAIKGNDSVTVKSGTVVAISTKGDGVKTENTDADNSGMTRGDILLLGGTVTVYAAGDGFQAAHDFEMAQGDDGSVPKVSIFTGSYSGYTASSASTTSYKGVKVQNELNVKAGSVDIKSYDDGLHADYGTAFTAGGTGQGTINISGGTVTMTVYSPEGSTGGGKMGPGGGRGGPGGGRGGWGGQKTVSGADAIHADYKLNITGGVINIDSAYEGLEANVITISGGQTYVTAVDDGVNATRGAATPLINVTGGYLEVAVSPSGDTDGIDSNGYYTQSGGIVITRGPYNMNMAAIDADGSVSVSGGTLIVLGYGRVSKSGSVSTYSLSLHSAGQHSVKIGGTAYTFNNAYSYGTTAIYSSVPVTA